MADGAKRTNAPGSRRGGPATRGATSRFVRPTPSKAFTHASSDGDGDVVTVTVRKGRPVLRGFGNVGAVFGDKRDYGKDELHPQIIKMARKSGVLNLSNKGLVDVPDKVFHLHEIENNEAKELTLNMAMDDSPDDRWWESVDLTKLYLNSNCITDLPPAIQLLHSLVILDLSDNQLKTLPVEMSELKSLQRLTLSHNSLTLLPDAAFNLPNLTILKLDHNNLSHLPNLGEVTVLDQLDVSYNGLLELPSSLAYLNRLTKLSLNNNKLRELPLEIGDLYGLQELEVNHNLLTSLPSTLRHLKKLTTLYLAFNRISSLPDDFMPPQLRELHLPNNCIKEITVAQLEGLTTLRVLDLRDNKLDVVPDEITLLQMLERLDLANNTLSSVPLHLGLLTHLKSMPLDGNPLRQLRRDIVQRGTEQLLKHLRDKLSSPPSAFPGFDSDSAHPDGDPVDEQPSLPDKWQLKNSRQMVYSEKAASVPEKLLHSAHEAEVAVVDVSGNVLTQLPELLSIMSDHVKDLVASSNRITILPAYLGSFSHLQFLNVSANRLTALPDELAGLKFLREVNVSNNRLTALPSCLHGSASLEILLAADNAITELPVTLIASWPRIATLAINNNNIAQLPPALGEVTQIRSLQLEGNPFRVPRAAILAKGTNEVMSYLRSRIVPETTSSASVVP